MTLCALLLIFAVLIDRWLGDPPYSYHPVRLLGLAIQGSEKLLRRLPLPDFWAGTLLTAGILILGCGIVVSIAVLLSFFPPLQWLFALYIIYSSIALEDLRRHVRAVVIALEEQNLEKSRFLLQKIVGRNTNVLDADGIARAAIETTAEGFVDGFFAPIFWYTLSCMLGSHLFDAPLMAGLAGVFGYRIINTLDSMIGYKSETYLFFGRAAAKLDDIINFLPARLSILPLFLGAWLRGDDAAKGLEHVEKFRLHAASPNAGHPESFYAGVLHIRLGGPVVYPFGTADKPFIGEGSLSPTPDMIRHALRLTSLSGYLATGVMAFLLVAFPSLYKILLNLEL